MSSETQKPSDSPSRDDLARPGGRRHTSFRHRGLTVLLLLVLMACGAGLRLAPWPEVFTADGVRYLVDTDTYYHVLRSQRVVENYPAIPWHDPNLNYPYGASILWPPLFDHLVATVSFAAAAGQPGPELVAAVAAFLPVFLGVMFLPLVYVLAKVFLGKRAPALGVVAAMAVLPAHRHFSLLGRPDQHCAEILILSLMILSFLKCRRRDEGSRGNLSWPLLFGFSIALAFWNWSGSAVYLILLALHGATWHLMSPEREHRAGGSPSADVKGAAVGLVLLIVSLRLFGRPDALAIMETEGVNAFHVTLVFLFLVYVLALQAARRMRRGAAAFGRRLLEAAGAALPPLALAVLLPWGFREAVLQALSHLGASNTWLENIYEFQPLLFGGLDPVSSSLKGILGNFGLALFFMPLAAADVVARWRKNPEQRQVLHFLLVWGGTFFLLTLLRRRFALYLVVPMAVWVWGALESVADRVAEWSPPSRKGTAWWGVLIAGTVLLLTPSLMHGGYGPAIDGNLQHALAWLKERPAPAPDRPAVLSQWKNGHAIQYFSEKPVLASPFGTDGGKGSLEDLAGFFLASEPGRADEVLRRRGIGFVLLANPRDEMHNIYGFAPAGSSPALEVKKRRIKGESVSLAPSFWEKIPSRLFFFDGQRSQSSNQPALTSYRLLYEGPLRRTSLRAMDRQVKIFEVVPGALLRVSNAPPAARIVAVTEIRTNQQRVFLWGTETVTDEKGQASFHLPYGTGKNGSVFASPYMIVSGGRQRQATVAPAAVLEERLVSLDFGG